MQTGWFAGYYDMLVMLLRYGYTLLTVSYQAEQGIKNYDKFYDVQAQGEYVETVEELLKLVNLYNETQINFEELFREGGGGKSKKSILLQNVCILPFITVAPQSVQELLTAMMRVNYNSDVDIVNGLAGLVGIGPLGLLLFCVCYLCHF